MAANKVLNFDKFMEEKNEETIKVTVFGNEYYVKSKIPAIVPIMMARSEATADQALATKMVMKAADAMFGTDVVDEFCNKGMSGVDLANLVQMLFKQINGQEIEDDDTEEFTDEDSRKATRTGKNSKK